MAATIIDSGTHGWYLLVMLGRACTSHLWAKWSREDKLPRWHSVVCHLIDVSAVCEALWDRALNRGMKTALAADLGLDVDSARRWVIFLVGAHDIGKVSPAFQSKVGVAQQNLTNLGYDFPIVGAPSPHGTVSAKVLPAILSSLRIPAKLGRQIATVVGGHHGVFPSADEIIRTDRGQIGRGLWEESRQEIIDSLAEITGVTDCKTPKSNKLSASIAMQLAGLTSVADWIGSSEDHFPFVGDCFELESYAAEAKRKAMAGIQHLGWMGWSPPEKPESLTTLFPFIRPGTERPLQLATVEVGEQLGDPSLVLIEAPMGEGKTEAAMYLADLGAALYKKRGCYFALPTQATSNQMFGRVRDFLETRYPSDLVNLQLLHGHAALSDDFKLLRERAHLREIYGEQSLDGAQSSVVASEWFTYRKRGLLAPFGVGTVDQVLMAVLQTRHVFVRLFALADKTVIVDEVHAYDAYMSTLLERLLSWLRALGTNVILLSATLPQARRQALLRAYGGTHSEDADATPYPRISWVQGDKIRAKSFTATRETRFKISWLPQEPTALGEKLRAALIDGGCAAVICNTVGEAQDTYSHLGAFFDDSELDLFHARFPFADRQAREQRTLSQFGKPPCNRPRRAVLVATQVIEQSLDIDFDLMVSSLAPADLLLQRAGRLHRHERPRPPMLGDANLWLLTPKMQADGCPDFGPSRYVYSPHVLLRSWLTLRERTAITVPSDVETCIESVYDDRKSPPDLDTAIHDAWNESRRELATEMESASREGQQRLIKPASTTLPIDRMIREPLEEDAPGIHQAFQAVTRLIEPTVTIACLGTSSNGTIILSNGAPFDLDASVSWTTAEQVLGSSLSVAHRGVVALLIEDSRVPMAWRQSVLLRHHHAVIFNAERTAVLGRYRIALDQKLGLLIHKVSPE